MNKPQKITRHILLLICFVFFTGGNAQAQMPEQQGLSAGQKKQVQFVGQSLLMAKRKASLPEAAEAQAVRESVNALKAQINSLLAPTPASKITIVPDTLPKAVSAVGANKSQLPSHSAHAIKVKSVRTALARLKKQCDAIAITREYKPGLWQRARTLLAGSGNKNTKHAVLTPLSNSAIAHLQTLGSAIEAALQLPNAERYAELRRLAGQLSVGGNQLALKTRANEKSRDNSSPVITPTLTTRTKHRRQF